MMSKKIRQKLDNLLQDWIIRSIGMVDATNFIVVADWDPKDNPKKRYPGDNDKKNNFWTILFSVDIEKCAYTGKVVYGGLNRCHVDGGTIDGKRYACIVGAGATVYFVDYDKDSFDYECNIQGAAAVSDVRLIGKHFYVAAAARQVFRRESAGEWILYSEEPFALWEKEGGGAATEVNGFAEDDLYFCSEDKELWRFDGSHWKQVDLPVNYPLYYLICHDDGYVYVGGLHGQLIRGRGDKWEVLVDWGTAQDCDFEMLLSMTFYQGTLYGGIAHGIVKYEEDRWVRTQIGPIRSGMLLKSKGDILLVGEPYALYLYDGKKAQTLYGNTKKLDAEFVLQQLNSIGTGLLESGHNFLDELSKGKKKPE